ncbi:hypothetical protein H0I25_11160 [Cellulophaga sp. HaHa_2_95]|uniref:hypothetical protein n=1 Tax=Cellulophaga sp. HaHa_2_95 TaxID=2745558 RepID=UPI001C4FFA45|nr:hypothetical protein [Cellulophaga sp. HaHa_2_95]QXP54645.1 hypothetical protein H0I25_11160 [Cellulophaga sp. HaHa_2_95]
MRNSFREIAAFMDPVDTARGLRKLLGMHLLEEGDGYREVWRRHNHPNVITERFFAFNTYLMDIPGAGRKPAVEYRDAEIGDFTEENFDICCLSEVWLREERKDLLDQWPDSVHVEHESGRASLINLTAMLGSSGLMTISRSHEIHHKNFYEYKNESGADKNAKKGCLLTVLMPIANRSSRIPSSLNIYSTHMNASGEAKNKQLFELVKFVWETMDKVAGDTSRPGRPGLNNNILCGDFNLDRYQRGGLLITDEILEWSEVRDLPGHLQRAVNHQVLPDGTVTNIVIGAKSAFSLLRDLLSVLGFKDLWSTRNGTAGYTSNLPTSPIASNVPIRDSEFPFYCDDNVIPNTRTSDRPTAIDHMFVTGSTSSTAFTIDFTRPRRPFTIRPDDAIDLDEIRFMSDHLGISTTIMLTPKQ